MCSRLILDMLILSNLVITPAAAQQGNEGVRLPLGFLLIETDSLPVSFETVSAQAADAFAAMDVDGDGKIDLAEMKTWRDTTAVRAGEDTLASLLKLDPKGLMQSADHNSDDVITPAETRALAFYDFNVHDADGNGALSSIELEAWQPIILQWASRPCLQFGVEEGMLLGAFCGK